MPLVSIIVPNYNHALYLPKRLASIFNQSFQDFEVILLDDCSTDNSNDILQSYADHPNVTHFIKNQNNSGSPFKQWNKGIDLAKGEYIWIAESDDWCDLQFIEKLLPLLSTNIGVVYCRSYRYDALTGQVTNHFFPERLDQSRWKKNFVADGVSELLQYHSRLNTIPNASSCIFKRHLAWFDERILSMRMCGDWLFWAYMLKKTQVAYLAESLNYWSFSNSTVWTHKDKEYERLRYYEFLDCLARINTLAHREKLHTSDYSWFLDWFFEKNPRWLFDFLFINPNPFYWHDYYLCILRRIISQMYVSMRYRMLSIKKRIVD